MSDRLDFGILNSDKIERIAAGGARIPARLTRVGVFKYPQPDGTVRRELRPPEEVFKQDSLDTLKDAPVIEGHPDMIDPTNYEQYNKGHVCEPAKPDGEFVSSKLLVGSASTLTKIDSGEIQEISLGYRCREDYTSGTWNGEPYDLIQRDIVYNHVGLGPRNWGRAGRDVGLRLDSDAPYVEERQTMKIRFDGKTYEAGSEEHVLALCSRLDALETQVAEEEKEKKDLCSESEKKDAKIDSLTEELTKTKAKLDAAVSTESIEKLCAERVGVMLAAQRVLGDTFKADGKSLREIMVETLTKVSPTAKLDGRSDEYVRARFDGIVDSGVRADSIDAVPGVIRKITDNAEASRTDSSKQEEERQKRLDAQNEPVWDVSKG